MHSFKFFSCLRFIQVLSSFVLLSVAFVANAGNYYVDPATAMTGTAKLSATGGCKAKQTFFNAVSGEVHRSVDNAFLGTGIVTAEGELLAGFDFSDQVYFKHNKSYSNRTVKVNGTWDALSFTNRLETQLGCTVSSARLLAAPTSNLVYVQKGSALSVTTKLNFTGISASKSKKIKGYLSFKGTGIVAAEDFSATGTVGQLTLGLSATGIFESIVDFDYFKITLMQGQQVQFDVEGCPTGQGCVNTEILGISLSDGVFIPSTFDLDSGAGTNARMQFTAPASSDYYLQVLSQTYTPGTYIVRATAINTTAEDTDGDGIPNATDNCPLNSNSTQTNSDNDGKGDVCDDDDDDDGALDVNDAFPLDANESIDTNHNGIGNNADTDDDSDGVLDVLDAYPVDATKSKLALTVTRQTGGNSYFTGTFQGTEQRFSHIGAAGFGQWYFYSGTPGDRVRVTVSDTGGLQEVLMMDQGSRMTVNYVGEERVEYRFYAPDLAFVYGTVLYRNGDKWFMGLMFTEVFSGYSDLLVATDITAQVNQALAQQGDGLAVSIDSKRFSVSLLALMKSFSPISSAYAQEELDWDPQKDMEAYVNTHMKEIGEIGTLVQRGFGADAANRLAEEIGEEWLNDRLRNPILDRLKNALSKSFGNVLKFFGKPSNELDEISDIVKVNPTAEATADFDSYSAPTSFTKLPSPVAPSPNIPGQPTPSAHVIKVVPFVATHGQELRLLVNGTNLGGIHGLKVSLNGCADMTELGGTDTYLYYSCVPALLGTQTGQVLDRNSSALLFEFAVVVSMAPPSLAAPVNVLANKTGDMSWEITWDTVPGASRYFIYQKLNSSPSVTAGEFDVFGANQPYMIASANSSRVHDQVDAEGTYFWVVVAVKGNELEEVSYLGLPSAAVSLKFGTTAPVITSFSNSKATLGQLLTVTFTGTDLSSGMPFTLEDCVGVQELPYGTDVKRQFSCTPTGAAGEKAGTIIYGNTVGNFNINVGLGLSNELWHDDLVIREVVSGKVTNFPNHEVDIPGDVIFDKIGSMAKAQRVWSHQGGTVTEYTGCGACGLGSSIRVVVTFSDVVDTHTYKRDK